MRVELLYFSGCPSYERLLPRLRELVAQAGGNPAAIETRRVESQETAAHARFLGSPTVRVNGRDVDPSVAERDDFGLKCRLYRSDDGQSSEPPERWIQAALADAAS
jgi:hypothetical protein